MGYATVEQVEAGFRTLTGEETEKVAALIEEASVIVDAYARGANNDIKAVVVCRMVRRAIDSGGGSAVPMGASQGATTAGPYTQSWTIGSGSAGEIYLSKLDKKMLGSSNSIGSYSPVEELVVTADD